MADPATAGTELRVDAAGVDVVGVTKTFDGLTRVLRGVDVSVDAGRHPGPAGTERLRQDDVAAHHRGARAPRRRERSPWATGC